MKCESAKGKAFAKSANLEFLLGRVGGAIFDRWLLCTARNSLFRQKGSKSVRKSGRLTRCILRLLIRGTIGMLVSSFAHNTDCCVLQLARKTHVAMAGRKHTSGIPSMHSEVGVWDLDPLLWHRPCHSTNKKKSRAWKAPENRKAEGSMLNASHVLSILHITSALSTNPRTHQ